MISNCFGLSQIESKLNLSSTARNELFQISFNDYLQLINDPNFNTNQIKLEIRNRFTADDNHRLIIIYQEIFNLFCWNKSSLEFNRSNCQRRILWNFNQKSWINSVKYQSTQFHISYLIFVVIVVEFIWDGNVSALVDFPNLQMLIFRNTFPHIATLWLGPCDRTTGCF